MAPQPNTESSLDNHKSWIGDKIYVAFEVFPLLLLVTTVLLVGSFQRTLDGSSGSVTVSLGGNIAPAMPANLILLLIPIVLAIWTGVWLGRKWAFGAEMLLVIFAMRSFISTSDALSVIGLALYVVRMIYIVLRLYNIIGPPLK